MSNSQRVLYNGQDLKGYLLDFSLADIGFGRVCNQQFLCEKISHQFEISTYFKGWHNNIYDIIYNDDALTIDW